MSEQMQEERIAYAFERMAQAFERIAEALEGIDETKQREYAKRWPAPGERREAVVTHVPSEIDRIRAEHGASSKPIERWYSAIEDEDESEGGAGGEAKTGPGREEFIGRREREFLAAQQRLAGAQAAGEGGPAGAGAEAAEGEA